MTFVTHVLRLVGLGLALACLATACVRLQEPDHFICSDDSDCADDERCARDYNYCVPKDSCNSAFDCSPNQQCNDQHHCVDSGCTNETAAVTCKGQMCRGGACETDCSFAGCIKGFHCDNGSCLPGAVANGTPCAVNADCSSSHCCQRPGGSVCASACYKEIGDACYRDYECTTGNCCADRNNIFSCSSAPCGSTPECLKDADCIFGQVCVQQKCVAPAALKSTGSSCSSSAECASSSCVQGICRGAAKGGAVCYIDADCEANRLCCKASASAANATCGEPNRGCAGSIGDACVVSSDCVGRDCNVDGFCTKNCEQDSDCGVSPWGVPNVCETGSSGSRHCFPGCTSSQQCEDNLNGDLVCLYASVGNAKFCTLP